MNPGTLSQAHPECCAFSAKRIRIVSRNAFGLGCEVSLRALGYARRIVLFWNREEEGCEDRHGERLHARHRSRIAARELEAEF